MCLLVVLCISAVFCSRCFLYGIFFGMYSVSVWGTCLCYCFLLLVWICGDSLLRYRCLYLLLLFFLFWCFCLCFSFHSFCLLFYVCFFVVWLSGWFFMFSFFLLCFVFSVFTFILCVFISEDLSTYLLQLPPLLAVVFIFFGVFCCC